MMHQDFNGTWYMFLVIVQFYLDYIDLDQHRLFVCLKNEKNSFVEEDFLWFQLQQ